jgi:hypothetical protein
MRIENIRRNLDQGMVRLSADIRWESCSRSETVFYETEESFAEAVACNPAPFLTACLIPAMFSGEERLKVDGAVCPLLLEGLNLNMRILTGWHYRPVQPVRIETSPEHPVEENFPDGLPSRTAVFLSGGLDSLYTLRMNRLHVADWMPDSIQDGILIDGFDIPIGHGSEGEKLFARARQALSPVLQETGLTLLPVRTNLRILNPDIGFWVDKFHGAALSSVAHFLGLRLGRVFIASSHAPENLEPWGSHPLLDPNYGSSTLKVIHHGLAGRLEKIRTISEWQVGFDNVRVCYKNTAESLNCCRCTKCTRTMIMLLALGKLHDAKAFPRPEISPTQLQGACRQTELVDLLTEFLPLVPALKERGYPELAAVMEKEAGPLARLRRFKWRRACRKWMAGFKRLLSSH